LRRARGGSFPHVHRKIVEFPLPESQTPGSPRGMALPMLTLDSTSEGVLAEHVYCRTTTAADPLAAAHAAKP
jgi:hypothetical protein